VPILNRSPRVLVLGTHNRKKLLELVELLGPLGFELKTLSDFPAALTVEETGDSFAANARLKATQQAIHLGEWVLGEDSGLVVPVLDGAPGIYSARFSGSDATDEKNNDHLLALLGDKPPERRAAYYVCYAALADPAGEIRAESEGRCHGRIRTKRSGSGGFGYDPLFEIVEYHRTFGELTPAVKAVLSHRARAMRLLAPQLQQLLVEHESACTT
jgi:XTP/dITP diphosphohydrolase